MKNKIKIEVTVALVALTALGSVAHAGEGGVGNGGDICEDRIKSSAMTLVRGLTREDLPI